MTIRIKHTNNAELSVRKEEVVRKLKRSYMDIDGNLLNIQEIKELGELGGLSHNERELYEELLRIEQLLGEDQ